MKVAIFRASRRLGFPFSRTRDIWYGGARRIDAKGMDRLRKEADCIEIAHAAARLEVLRSIMQACESPVSRQVVAGINAALHALGRG